jgi:hypothetical protein
MIIILNHIKERILRESEHLVPNSCETCDISIEPNTIYYIALVRSTAGFYVCRSMCARCHYYNRDPFLDEDGKSFEYVQVRSPEKTTDRNRW